MNLKSKKSLAIAGALVLLVIAWSILLFFYDTEQIVDYIGVRNGYLIMFFISLFGGVSSIGGPTYIAALLTLASGGLSPIGLAIASGLGVSIGDTIYFLIGRHGVRSLVTRNERLAVWTQKLTVWLSSKPDWFTFLGAYLYTGFTPLPNDVLSIGLGVAKRPYLICISAMVLGNITLTFIIASFGTVLPF